MSRNSAVCPPTAVAKGARNGSRPAGLAPRSLELARIQQQYRDAISALIALIPAVVASPIAQPT